MTPYVTHPVITGGAPLVAWFAYGEWWISYVVYPSAFQIRSREVSGGC